MSLAVMVRRIGFGASMAALVGATVIVAAPMPAELLGFAPALAQQRPDGDRDGLYDNDEADIYGTDPANPDSDGDGLDDGQEVYDGTDPRTANGPAKSCPDGATPVGGYCPTPTPMPLPTPSAGPLPTPTAFPRPTPTGGPLPTPTAGPLPTPTGRPLPTPTALPLPTPTG